MPAHTQPPPAQQQPGYLRLHLQGSMWTSNFVAPSVRVDGWFVPATYGENVYPVPPGQHVVAAETRWMRTYGQAQVAFRVGSGQVADVWYVAPFAQFSTGSMGFEKQRRRDTGAFVGVLAVVGLVLVLGAVPAVLGAA